MVKMSFSAEEINNTTTMTSGAAVVGVAATDVSDADIGYSGSDLIDLIDSQDDYFRLYDANELDAANIAAGDGSVGGGGATAAGMLDVSDESAGGVSSIISNFIVGIWNPLNYSNQTSGNLSSMNPVSDANTNADYNLTTWTMSSSTLVVSSTDDVVAAAVSPSITSSVTSSALAAAVNAVSTASYSNYSAYHNSTTAPTAATTTTTAVAAASTVTTVSSYTSYSANSTNDDTVSYSDSEYGHLFSTVAQALASAASSAVGESNNYGDADVADVDIALIDSAETVLEAGGSDTDYDAAAGGFNGAGGGIGGGDDELIHQSIAYASGLAHNESFRQSFDGGGSGGGRSSYGAADKEATAANGGSTFMLLLEDFGEYFYNYNGSTVSGTTTISSSNITDFDYRTNCTNFNSTTSTCYDLSEVEQNYWALILILFPILTLFGNILVIMSVYRERSLQTVTNYFIVSLAIADLLVAVVVMPFAVYVLFNGIWALPNVACDFYIAMDVICSTSSIFNLVAISIDRYMAVTRPIQYAKHKNSTRVTLTILLVWAISAAIGSPIVLGLNNTPNRDPDLCVFYNTDFILYSSLISFYIPCIMMVFLYWNIFKALRTRARKQRAARKPHLSELTGGSVIENIAQTRRLAETALDSVGGGRGGGTNASRIMPDEPATNTASGSNEEEDENAISPDIDDCHVIVNDKSTEFMLATVVEETGNVVAQITTQPQLHVAAVPNGNHDSGYAPSNVDDVLAGTADDSSPPDSPVPSSGTLKRSSRRNTADGEGSASSPKREAALSVAMKPLAMVRHGGVQEAITLARNDSTLSTTSKNSSRKDKKNSQASRFTIYKVHKASKKKREKSSAKKERKATKTLAIVLGVFLFCWVPFFTCNIMDAMCAKLHRDCRPGVTAFMLTTWLGYINSFVNPVIYTIFNPEFRKAFKKIMHMG